jgi:GWxTD domain-containing protein
MRSIVFLLFLLPIVSRAQALREINFRHLYDPETPVNVLIKPVREPSAWSCHFSVSQTDTTLSVDDLVVEWFIRRSLGNEEGTVIPSDKVSTNVRVHHSISGVITTDLSEDVQFLVARVKSQRLGKSYIFYKALEPKFPETTPLEADGKAMLKSYVNVGSTMKLGGNGTHTVSYYNDDFPTAPLAFAEALGRVSKQLKVDSVFKIESNEPFVVSNTGLYLIQQDTLSSEGVSFRVEEDYPRYRKIKSIAEPLAYICTSQEYARIKQADGDKKAFDRVILNITKDSERARILMRSYFRRVELANRYFSSYKEGWKTDRGMIYIIFGVPDEVFRFSDREVWNYKSREYKVNFDFAKSPSLFDPSNFVLIRQKRYSDTWYEVVDLWRNARF